MLAITIISYFILDWHSYYVLCTVLFILGISPSIVSSTQKQSGATQISEVL